MQSLYPYKLMKKIEQTKEISIPLPSPAKRYYRHGWQSWSLATWQDVDQTLQIPKPVRLHSMQYDPVYIREKRPHGSWVGAVEMQNGETLLLGALGLDAHVFLEGNKLIGRYENDRGEWLIAEGDEQEVFAQYAAALKYKFSMQPYRRSVPEWVSNLPENETVSAQKHAPRRFKNPPTVWCSWYSFYTHINAKNFTQALHDLGDLPFDVFQVDDGWQRAIGDWIPNEKFPEGMDGFAAQIRRTERTPGLWLAPLLVVPSSDTYRQHKDWLLRDKKGKLVSAGFNWSEPLYALDTTHPDVLEWLSAVMSQVRAWGYDYIKLDFLYAGALPGARHTDMPREQAYRQGLYTLREALGGAYFLTCGAPIIPSLGLCDGMRVGPDVASHWASERDDLLLANFAIPGTQNAIRTTVNRLWLSPFVHTDPDVAYFASDKNAMNATQEKMLQNLAQICNYKATSDMPAWWSAEERKYLREFLLKTPRTERISRYKFTLAEREVDFSPAMEISLPKWYERIIGALLGWAGNQRVVLNVLNWLGEKEIKRKFKD